MFGAIIGDVSGSRFEFNNNKSRDFEFFAFRNKEIDNVKISYQSYSFITDDTIMTTAVANIILDNDFSEKNIINRFQEWGRRYPNMSYGARFGEWLFLNNPKPYNSYGNGSAMRISPVALYYDDWEEIKEKTIKITEVTHNHTEGIKGALAVSRCIYLAKNKKTKDEIKLDITQMFKYDLSFTVEDKHKYYVYNETCQRTVPEAIVCFLESDSIESTARNAMYIGGDCDTSAAIACSIAEAFYGRDIKLERKLLNNVITEDIRKIINEFYDRINIK